MTEWDFAYFLKAFSSFYLLPQTSPGEIAPDHMALLKSAQSVCCLLAMWSTIMSPLLFECLRWMPFPFSFVIVFLTFLGARLLRTSNPLAEICNDIYFLIFVFLSHFKTINKRFGTLFRLCRCQRNLTSATHAVI